MLIKPHDIRYHKRKRWIPATTDSKHNHLIAPNQLNMNFNVLKPDTVWVVDINYVATDEGWLYLSAIKDLSTCEIVGRSMDAYEKHPVRKCPKYGVATSKARQGVDPSFGSRRAICLQGLQETVEKAQGKAIHEPQGQLLGQRPMESFYNSLKTECVYRTRFRTIKQAKAALFDYIEMFYNRKRLHSAIGYRTPQEAFNEMTVKAA